MSAASIQSKLNSVFNAQVTNQFGSQRYALLFKPGTYNVDANVGFYTQVAGLGLSPDAAPSTAPCTPRPTGSRQRDAELLALRRESVHQPHG